MKCWMQYFLPKTHKSLNMWGRLVCTSTLSTIFVVVAIFQYASQRNMNTMPFLNDNEKKKTNFMNPNGVKSYFYFTVAQKRYEKRVYMSESKDLFSLMIRFPIFYLLEEKGVHKNFYFVNFFFSP